MNQTLNAGDVRANDADPPVEFTHIGQILVILGFLLCVLCLLYYILNRVERRRSDKIRVIPKVLRS